jgi:hypothetical protein
MSQQLIEDIMKKLKIDGGIYIQMEIEDHIKHIDQSQYLEFFKALSGDEFSYKNPMDRIAIVANRFKKQKDDKLLAGTRSQAKEMYDKFYDECCAMLDYCRDNRDKHPHDREFFEAVDFAKLKKKDGTDAYTKQELYVLSELGGGSWLIDIRFYDNSKVVVDKIEKIIKDAITTKYNQQQAISHNVNKMLKK